VKAQRRAVPTPVVALTTLLCLVAVAACRPAGEVVPAAAVGEGGGPAPILAGAASRPITPDLDGDRPVRVGGFTPGRDATGVHDDLYARAIALEIGTQSLTLVALDLIGLFYDDVVLIREELSNRRIAVGSVLVASTHTHAGPDVIGLWTPADRDLDPSYLAMVRDAAADAVEEAWESRRPARLSFARWRMPDLLRDTRLPLAVDDLGLLLRIDTDDGSETIASLVNFAAHPESLGRQNSLISSDYPWATRRILEEAYGGMALFFSGAVGGMMTPLGVQIDDPLTGSPAPQKSPRMAELLGENLADGLMAAWSDRPAREEDGPRFIDRAVLSIAQRPLRVPLDNPGFVAGLEQGRIWPRRLDRDGSIASEVAAVTISSAPDRRPVAQFACVPGELYPELAIGGIQEPQDPAADLQGAPREPHLREMMSAPYRFVLGLCNDEIGYIIPAAQWDEAPPFAYGRDRPQYGEERSAGPRTAPIILQAFSELFR
jgi:hypothetical protein